MPFSVLLLIKNQQYFIFIFKKINSSCQLLAGYTRVNTFYRSLLNLQKGLHSVEIIKKCEAWGMKKTDRNFYEKDVPKSEITNLRIERKDLLHK